MKTFLLVHGGWHGGWCWKRVSNLLQNRGHRAFSPTLTGLGERAHLMRPDITLQTGIDDILGVLQAEELNDVVLVGHSAGGAIITGVADQVPDRIRSIIWLDGLILQDGESLRTHFTPPQEETFQRVLETGGASFAPPPPEAFGILPGPDADWLYRRLTPQPFGTASSPLRLKHPIGNGLECIYLACISPVHPFVASSHSFAQKQNLWRWREINACHDAMITAPEAVACALEDLA